mgnify:CR=1 FL=1
MVKQIVRDVFFLGQPSEPATKADIQVGKDLQDTLQANRERCVGMAANMIGVKKNKDIDDSEVLSGECINSPVLGQIPPERLSGGVKTLLLILNEPDRIFNASTCGDNCAKWILEIGRIKDVTINLRHMMSFGKDTKFEIKVQNGGETAHSMKELIPIANKYLYEMKPE